MSALLDARMPSEFARNEQAIEIRALDFTLIERGITDSRIELSPGTYIVTANHPSGIRFISEPVELEADEIKSIELKVSETQFGPRHQRRPEPQYYHAKLFPSEGVKIEVLEGNGFAEPFRPAPHRVNTKLINVDSDIATYECTCNSENESNKLEPLLLRFTQEYPFKFEYNVRLPIAEGWHDRYVNVFRCFVVLRDPFFVPEVWLQHGVANQLLVYQLRNKFSDVETLVKHLMLRQRNNIGEPAAISAEELLLHKNADPFAAAVGAYTLLRLGELDKLHDWTENLMNWFPWLPDGLIIRAEHLAREGEHTQALKLLEQVSLRGLPIFSDGLTYAIDRLRSYANGSKKFVRRSLLDSLTKFAQSVDFTRPVLTYYGSSTKRGWALYDKLMFGD